MITKFEFLVIAFVFMQSNITQQYSILLLYPDITHETQDHDIFIDYTNISYTAF